MNTAVVMAGRAPQKRGWLSMGKQRTTDNSWKKFPSSIASKQAAMKVYRKEEILTASNVQ